MLEWKKLVVVSDPKEKRREYSIERNDSEGYSQTIISDIEDALAQLADEVFVVDDIEEFARSADKLSDAIVVPCYFGSASRTSKALVPAICEATGIPYIGADSYVHALCNDKYFSRIYGRDFGLRVSEAVLVSDPADLERSTIDRLRLPVVVKPNFGGGSNGIDAISLCGTHKEARNLARKLLAFQGVPIVVETYVPGEEVQVIFAKLPDGSTIVEQVEILIDGKRYYESELFDMSVKKRKRQPVSFEVVKSIRPDDIAIMQSVFDSFSPTGFMRVDCRVNCSGEATLLELSPDCSLGRGSGMFCAFREHGFDYAGMFEALIRAALSTRR